MCIYPPRDCYARPRLLHHGDGNWNYLQRVLQGPRGLSDALFLVNIFAYISLNLCTLVRIYLFPRKVWADLVDPQRVFSFFTIIAGSDVLGMGLDLRDFGVGTAIVLGIRVIFVASSHLLISSLIGLHIH